MKFLRLNHKGDTIIEVMLAMALLTAFLFISWGITNKSTQMGINARKRTEMVNAMKEQAEALKAMYVQNGSSVTTIIDRVGRTTNGLDEQSCNPDALSGATDNENGTNFHYAQNGTSIDKIHQKKQLPDENNRVWLQYQPESGDTPTYYDFYVRACWQTVGSAQNTDNAQFIVRLNQGGATTIIPEEDGPVILDSGIWTLAWEEYGYTDASVVSRDFNDFVMNVRVRETFIDVAGTKYLDKIEMRFTPRHVGHEVSHSDKRFRVVLPINMTNTYCQGLTSGFQWYEGAPPSVVYQLIENGTAVADSKHGFVTGLASNIMVIFNDTRNTLSASGALRQEATVTVTGFERIPANTLEGRKRFTATISPSYTEFPGISATTPNIRRYRIQLAEYVPSNGPTESYSGWRHIDHTAYGALGSGALFSIANNLEGHGLFVPADWQWPNEGQSIADRYPGISHHVNYLNSQCRTSSWSGGYSDEEPVAPGSSMWWEL